MYFLSIFLIFLSFFSFFSCLQLTATHDVHIGLEKEIPLSLSSISVSHKVSTKSLQAQRYFDQGLTFLYAFNHDAAYASFRKASQIDPQLAMAYWGMAIALGTNINSKVTIERQQKAYQHSQQSMQLFSKANKNEQAYIKALSKRYTSANSPDFNQLDLDYKNAMKEVVAQYPDDLDAATLYAESLLDLHPWNQWTLNGQPNEGTEEAIEVLESVMKKYPMHLGANHFYIHAMEASKTPEKALISADRLTQLAPLSGHIQHMPSHIYLLVGDYKQAVEANIKAVKNDFDYIQQFGAQGYPIHYLSHNLAMLSRAYDLSGQFTKSIQTAKELYQFFYDYYPETKQLEVYAPTYLFVLIHFHKWKQILDTPPPPADFKLTTVLWHFAQSLAFAATGRLEKSKEQETLFDLGSKNLSPSLFYGNNKVEDILAIAQLYLKAQVANEKNFLPQALYFLKQGIEKEDALKYDEPTNWPFSLRESLGGALLKIKDYLQAEVVFRQDLELHPGSGRALYGLFLSLEAQHKEIEANFIKQRLDRAWHLSDSCLNQEFLY